MPAEDRASPMPVDFIDTLLDDGATPKILGFADDDATHGVLVDHLAARKVASRVGPGGVAGAIDHLAENPSPPFLVVDLGASADPRADIDSLADMCEPGTAVIALGRDNDVNLFRDLMESGITDYLVKPVTVEQIGGALDRAIRRAEEEQEGPPEKSFQGRLMTVFGSRGGVGASTVAVNCAWQIASQGETRVMLVDLDLRFGSVALALDLEPGKGLREMLENPGRIDSLFVASAAATAGKGLHVLGGEETLDGTLDFESEALEMLLGELRRNYDCVIVDAPRAMVVENPVILTMASTVTVVTELSLVGMRDTMRVGDLITEVAPKATRLIVANRVGSDKKNELPRGEFERGVETKITHLVPYDSKAARGALNAGKPIQVAAKGSKVVGALNKLCKSFLRDEEDANKPAKTKNGFTFGRGRAGGKDKGSGLFARWKKA